MKTIQIKSICRLGLMTLFLGIWCQPAEAAIPIAEIIRQGVKKIIVAVDLKIQRLQNETIWMQQVQQKMENVLSETQLKEISSWSKQQKELYGDYYEGLWKVKSVLGQYQKIRDITQTQAELIKAYQQSWKLLTSSGQFSPDELDLIQSRYGVILQAGVRNLSQLTTVIKSFSFQISDGERLERIHVLDREMNQNYRDLLGLNMQLESVNRQRTAWQLEGKSMENILR
jgi:hypothetical protein